jgi:hypothetical protein
VPQVISMIDYRKGFGQTETVRVRRADVARTPVRAAGIAAIPEEEVQQGAPRSIGLDERLKRAVRQHPRRDEPRVDSVEPPESKCG